MSDMFLDYIATIFDGLVAILTLTLLMMRCRVVVCA